MSLRAEMTKQRELNKIQKIEVLLLQEQISRLQSMTTDTQDCSTQTEIEEEVRDDTIIASNGCEILTRCCETQTDSPACALELVNSTLSDSQCTPNQTTQGAAAKPKRSRRRKPKKNRNTTESIKEDSSIQPMSIGAKEEQSTDGAQLLNSQWRSAVRGHHSNGSQPLTSHEACEINPVPVVADSLVPKSEIVATPNDALARSIFIYGIKESEAKTGDLRKRDDYEALAAIVKATIGEMSDKVKVLQLFRIGRRHEDEEEASTKPRPVKVIFATAEQAKVFLQKAKALKWINSSLFFRKEYSLAERIKWRTAKVQLQKLRAAGETGLTIRNGEVVKLRVWSKPITITRDSKLPWQT